MKAENLQYTLGLMTATQKRRWELYFKYHSFCKVATIEGVSYQAIQHTLQQGVKRAKKMLNLEILGL